MELKNVVIVITGGSKGLGKALAKQLVQQGAIVTLSGRDATNLEKTVRDIGVEGVSADVTNEVLMSKLAHEVMQNHGHIDVWIQKLRCWP